MSVLIFIENITGLFNMQKYSYLSIVKIFFDT